jgi:hypothetical protein
MVTLCIAKILSSSEINSLHTFLSGSICYDCSSCSATSDYGWACSPAACNRIEGIGEKWLQKYRIWVDRIPGVSLVALASWTDCNFIGNHESNTRSVTEKAVGNRL